MDFRDFKTGKDDISRRLDKVIRLFASDLSLAEIYKAIRKGLIKVNNKKTKSDYRIQENDTISIAEFLFNKNENIINDKIEKNNKEQLNMPEIVFENSHILIINKPYDVNVHGDINSLDKIIDNYYNSKNIKTSLSFKPGPLHRLDKKTTGLLAFSMSLEGAHWFSENIQNHTIQKKYYGLVEGLISKKEHWCDFISKEKDRENDKGFHKVQATSKQGTFAKEENAETIVNPIESGKCNGKTVTLVEFHIKTGRKHQIRAQSSLHHHPLAGDLAYGGHKIKNSPQEFYLTAKELIFPKENPLGLPENLKVMLPKDFINVLNYCEIKKTGV